MVVHLFSAIVSIYVIARLVWPLPRSRKGKVLASLVVFVLISQHHLFTSLFFGTLASPEIPGGLIMFFGWMYGAFLLAGAFCLIRDIGVFLLFVLRKFGFPAGNLLSGKKVSYFICVAALVLSASGVWQAVLVPDVTRLEIYLEDLPEEFEGLSIVQLTDIHASRLLEAGWVEQVVAKANALEPDLILLTGDMVDGLVVNRSNDVAPLGDLKAGLGVYSIPGNHEYYSEYNAWINKFAELRLNMLFNEHVIISRNGAELVLAGTTDRVAERFELPLPDVSAALAGIPENRIVILMAHQPIGARENAAAGVDLQLSGHTHGGQIIGLRILSQWVNDGFISGLYQVGGMQLYVSNGAGLWNGLPVRIGVPSEITEIILRKGSG